MLPLLLNTLGTMAHKQTQKYSSVSVKRVAGRVEKRSSTAQVYYSVHCLVIKAMKRQVRGRHYCPEEAWEQKPHRLHSNWQETRQLWWYRCLMGKWTSGTVVALFWLIEWNINAIQPSIWLYGEELLLFVVFSLLHIRVRFEWCFTAIWRKDWHCSLFPLQ